MKLAVPMMTLLLACLAGCAERAPTPADAPAADVAPAAAADDVPPATAPASATAALRANGAIVADGAISFAGFGAARFGATAQAVRDAWGNGLDGTAEEPGGCHYLLPQARAQGGYGVGFMIEGERFVRIDVDSADIVAPGGGRIGMDAGDIGELYASVQQQPHKYVDGARYLRIADPAGGEGVLLFETDAGSRITEWRVGVPPQVDYVEGCS